MRFLLISFFSIQFLKAEPWFDYDHIDLIYLKNEISYNCELPAPSFNRSPISLHKLQSYINNIRKTNLNKNCQASLERASFVLANKLSKVELILGIQTKTDDIFLQERGERFYKNTNIYFSRSEVINKFAYKLNIKKFKNEMYFDDSYVSYLINNHMFVKLGRTKKWWSPSDNASLILSNNARPFPNVTIATYKSITPKYDFFSFLGKYDFEVFLGKLERDREIPNTLIFGNKFSFKPFKNLDLSLMRVAQFGGKNRSINSDVIKNMLLGKDTTNSNLGFSEQPGNQIAGIDFSLRVFDQNFIEIYGQFMGEDGLDPIIDDRWIGAIFPSKRFGSFGINKNFYMNNANWVFNLEHINTDSGYKNVTYNHGLYKDGYRYHGYSMGANIDGDSHKNSISISKQSLNTSLKIKLSDVKINQNNNSLKRFGNQQINFHELSMHLIKDLRADLRLEAVIKHRDINIDEFNNEFLIIRIEKRL